MPMSVCLSCFKHKFIIRALHFHVCGSDFKLVFLLSLSFSSQGMLNQRDWAYNSWSYCNHYKVELRELSPCPRPGISTATPTSRGG